MKPLQKIKKPDGKVKEWRGLGTICTVYFEDFSPSAEIILIAGDREALKKAFFKMCGQNAIFQVGKLRRVKVTEP